MTVPLEHALLYEFFDGYIHQVVINVTTYRWIPVLPSVLSDYCHFMVASGLEDTRGKITVGGYNTLSSEVGSGSIV
jgi:hypothetical protein